MAEGVWKGTYLKVFGRSKQLSPNKREKKREKTDENSGHYVIASSRLPERRTLVPIDT